MEQLEAFYENIPKPSGFVDRKYEIPSYTFNLYGPPKSGKSWLILDYLHTLPRKKRLYINLADLRLDKSSLIRTLPEFVEKRGVETLVIDHFDGEFIPPPCRQLILISRAPRPLDKMMPLLPIEPLDFEEFLAFERRHLNLEHSFSNYLRTGSLPQMANQNESMLTLSHHAIVQALFPDRTDLVLWRNLAQYQGKPVTPHQLYTRIRKDYKISKNRLYATLKRWEEEGVFLWLPKLGQARGTGKVIFFDFALPASMYFEKSLIGQLATLAAKRWLRQYPDTVYTDRIDLVEPNSQHALFISPFATQQSAAEKIAQSIEHLESLSIRRITILTITNKFSFTFETIPVEGKPFYEWILEE